MLLCTPCNYHLQIRPENELSLMPGTTRKPISSTFIFCVTMNWYSLSLDAQFLQGSIKVPMNLKSSENLAAPGSA